MSKSRKNELAQKFPGLPPDVAAHAVRRLRALDWRELQHIAATCCADCPGLDMPDGPPCEFCPLRPLTLDLGITAARARAAQHDDDYLRSLPIDPQ